MVETTGIAWWVLHEYHEGMFVRKNRNRSGSVSVQIIEKSAGKYRVVQTLGSSHDPDEIARLVHAATHTLARPSEGQTKLFPARTPEALAVETFVQNLTNTQIRTIGPERIFGTLFDRIGFHAIPDPLFRHLVIARLAYPTSKLKTVDYLQRYRGITMSVDALYRSLDRLRDRFKETAERIAYDFTKRTIGTITVIFYDLTTLYFEAEDEDDLRKVGFSKDGKFQHPQIMLGLLVGPHGFPIGYDLFPGNTFEGKTLIPTIEQMQRKYALGKPIVVADAGLLSRENLMALTGHGFEFIIGARIKNEPDAVRADLLHRRRSMGDGDHATFTRADGTRLIVTYTERRARKDAHNRERGLRTLRQRVVSGRLTKRHINDRGYNKFLTLTGDVTVTIDETKVEADRSWDGLKGYVTNAALHPDTIVEHYGHLWQIERAFRISKTDLRIRPIFHYRRRRIEAHVCIAFVAYTIYTELERLLKEHGVAMSARRAAELTQTMYELEYTLPGEIERQRTMLQWDDEQRLLAAAVHG